DETVRLWEAASGKEKMCLREASSARESTARDDERGPQVAWSPDGKILATIRDDAVHLWDPATGKEIFPSRGHTAGIFAACWSPDGQRLVSGGHDGTIRLWDPATAQEMLVLNGHGGAVAWSPDSKLIASGCQDNSIRLWDPADGKEIRRLGG